MDQGPADVKDVLLPGRVVHIFDIVVRQAQARQVKLLPFVVYYSTILHLKWRAGQPCRPFKLVDAVRCFVYECGSLLTRFRLITQECYDGRTIELLLVTRPSTIVCQCYFSGVVNQLVIMLTFENRPEKNIKDVDVASLTTSLISCLCQNCFLILFFFHKHRANSSWHLWLV